MAVWTDLQRRNLRKGNFKGYWLDPQGQWLAMLKIDTTEYPNILWAPQVINV